MNAIMDHKTNEYSRINSSNVSPGSDVFEPAFSNHGHSSRGEESPRSCSSREERRKTASESKFKRSLCSPIMAEPSASLMHQVGHKLHEVFQLKQGSYADLSPSKISEMMKSNSLDNAPTQTLLSVVNGILDESVERKNGEVTHRVAALLRKVVQEIERRISTQAEHLRTQNNLFKTREQKYLSRIRLLETLATGTNVETRNDKPHLEEKKKDEEQELVRLTSEKDKNDQEIAVLKQELEIVRKTYEQHFIKLEKESNGAQEELRDRLKDTVNLLTESRNRIKELEANTVTKSENWNKKEHIYQIFAEVHLGTLRELRTASQTIKQEIFETQRNYSEDFNHLGVKIKTLEKAAEGYYGILSENQKLHHELQELKGNIRVYCRIRPFPPGKGKSQTTIENIGENGELIIANPTKQGKDGRRLFKFNKVYGPAATQVEVFSDTQPLIQSVVDGYNVCIFAYGQTGSGKTYTMTGPDGASEDKWGVNYRALNDLFRISQSRKRTYTYEISVQMLEIYNEQVRDLLSSDPSKKNLGILASSQPDGLTVPDATILPVKSTNDVLELMEIGLSNRAKGATALNERSSRSHSMLTIHVRGMDAKTGASWHGCLHLVDLAGSERVDRSEVTGDRLKEAQHINKSLSALGDVIFALAQKNSHVPYRNSKLTQVLQSSLGGQAKTLMFVQLNPDVVSYSETMSTLKFAERVSGVELGAARSTKDGGDVRELREQVANLKDTIAKKDKEIEKLQQFKDLKTAYHNINGEKRGIASPRQGSSTTSKTMLGNSRSLKVSSGGKSLGNPERVSFDQDNSSENSDKNSISNLHHSVDDFHSQKEYLRLLSSPVVNEASSDPDVIGSNSERNERILKDISDTVISTASDASHPTENNPHSEDIKRSENKDISNSPRMARMQPKLAKSPSRAPTGTQ